MKSIKRLVVVFLSACLLFAVLQYALLPVFLRHEKVHEKLLEAFSREMKGTVKFASFSLEVFPNLSFKVTELSYVSRNETEPLRLEADRLVARLSLFALFQKKLKLRDLVLKNASLSGKTRLFSHKPAPFLVKGLAIEARRIRNRDLGSLRARGRLFSEEGHFEVSGSIHLGDLVNFRMEELLLDVVFKFDRLPLEPILGNRLAVLPLKVIDGRLSGKLRLIKKEKAPKGEWSADLEFADVIYGDLGNPRLKFDKVSQRFESRGLWDTASGLVSIVSSRLSSDGVQGEFTGSFHVSDKGLEDFNVHAALPEFDFEKGARDYPFLPYWFRDVRAVCSGLSEVRFLAEGNFKSFKLHGEIILNEAAIDSAYFRKSKGVPFALTADLARREEGTWSGEFDVRYRELKAKGVISEWNSGTRELEYNLLTNKFHFSTFLEALALSHDGADWEGDAKVLLHYRGLIDAPDLAKMYGVITLNGLRYQFRNLPFRTPALETTLKIEDTEIYSEGCSLDFGASQARCKLNWRGWKNPRVEWTVTGDKVRCGTLWSPNTEVRRAIDRARTAYREKLEGTLGLDASAKSGAGAKDTSVKTLPEWLQNMKSYGTVEFGSLELLGLTFEKVQTHLLVEDGRWRILPVVMRSNEGTLWMSGGGGLRSDERPELKIAGKLVSLERLDLMSEKLPVRLTGRISFDLENEKAPGSLWSGRLLVRDGSVTAFAPLAAFAALYGEKRPEETCAFRMLGARFNILKAENIFPEVLLDAGDYSLDGSLAWDRGGGIRATGTAYFTRRLASRWQAGEPRDAGLEARFTLSGRQDSPKIEFDPKTARSLADDSIFEDLERRYAPYRDLERQGPPRASAPRKEEFLMKEVSLEGREKERRVGFFEALFGRRH